MSIPKVFISYSHDTKEHKMWVLELANRMRAEGGVDAILDQWDLKPGYDVPNYMEKNLKECDFVIMICTERYVNKANSGEGGVGYEKMIITSELMKSINSEKIIPIIRQEGTHLLPTFLKTKLYLDFSITDDFEFSYDDLIRRIHDSPLYKKPEIGLNPFEKKTTTTTTITTPSSKTTSIPRKSGDAIYKLISVMVGEFEKGHTWMDYSTIHRLMGTSRVMFDLILNQAKEKGYIKQNRRDALFLDDHGKYYAVEYDIIKS